jgi:hypothetical protein
LVVEGREVVACDVHERREESEHGRRSRPGDPEPGEEAVERPRSRYLAVNLDEKPIKQNFRTKIQNWIEKVRLELRFMKEQCQDRVIIKQ